MGTVASRAFALGNVAANEGNESCCGPYDSALFEPLNEAQPGRDDAVAATGRHGKTIPARPLGKRRYGAGAPPPMPYLLAARG